MLGRNADATVVVTLLGRTLVVLGGAFLLRAITDSGRLPRFGGVVLGFAYASAWIGAADFAAVRRPASGFFHGLTGIAIGFPLLIEAATRFGAMPATGAAALLAGMTVAILVVSWHRRLQALAAVTALAASVTALMGAFTTGHFVPFAAASIVMGAAASMVCMRRDWHLPAWPLALTGTLIVLLAAARSLAAAETEAKIESLAVAMGLAGVYFALAIPALTARTDSPRLGELARAAMGLVFGIGVALLVANQLGDLVPRALGAGLTTAGLVMYAIVLRCGDVTGRRGSVFLSSVAVAAFCAGNLAAVPDVARDLAFAVAVLELVRSSRPGLRPWLYTHAAVVATVLANSSGLVAFSVDAWTGLAVEAVPPAMGGAAVVFYAGLMRPDSAGTMRWPRAVSFVQLWLALFGAAAGVVVLVGAIDGLPSIPSVVATERSVVLAAAAVILAAVGKSTRNAVFRWLSYAALGLGTVKLLAEDLMVSSPVGLFVAFGAFGLALIASSRREGARGGDSDP